MFKDILGILYYLIPIIVGNENEETNGAEKKEKVITQFLMLLESKEIPIKIPLFLMPFLKSFLGICIDYLVRYLNENSAFEHFISKMPKQPLY